jgi:poly-gamma-glutamate synthesis protein (capsule biosynthesis protein)
MFNKIGCLSFFIAFFLTSAVRAEGPAIEILCVGDVMMAHGMKSFLKKKGPVYPFEKVLPLLSNADIVFGNLENPISARGKDRFPEKEYHFLMDPEATEGLKKAGFRVMSVANNHILDFGPQALEDTLKHLTDHGILFTGAGAC